MREGRLAAFSQVCSFFLELKQLHPPHRICDCRRFMSAELSVWVGNMERSFCSIP